MILLQISYPNRDDGRLWYRCERTIIDGSYIVTRTEWDIDGNITSIITRPATDYEQSIVAEPDCPLIEPE